MLVMISPDNHFREWKYTKCVFVVCIIQCSFIPREYVLFSLDFVEEVNLAEMKKNTHWYGNYK